MPASATQRAEAAERRSRALQLRLAGVSFEQIGQQLGGISPQRAHQLYQAALKQIVQEPNEELLAVEQERLDMLYRAMVTRALQGSARHAEVALHLLESKRKLLGLDAPTKHEVLTIDAIDAEIAKLQVELAG